MGRPFFIITFFLCLHMALVSLPLLAAQPFGKEALAIRQDDKKQEQKRKDAKKSGQQEKDVQKPNSGKPEIKEIPRARKQSRPVVVAKPKVKVKPIKIVRPKIKKP